MHVLITGGAGFIGSHLAEAYLQRGDWVTVIDDLSTGSIRNINHLKSNERFAYVIDDVCHARVTAELVDMADVVFHLAAAVGVKLIVERPVHTITTNLEGTEVVLEQASKKSKKVIIASTSEVYGKSESFPFNEEQDLVIGATRRARWAYACSKAMDEFMALAYHRERNLPATVVRLFNTVGPRQTGRYGMVIPTFVDQALRNKPITVYGDGKQRRCFGHVFDTVKCLVALAEHPGAIGKVVNIGSQHEISILDLAKLVIKITDSRSEIKFVPYEEAYAEGFEDMMRRIPDTSRLKELVGFAPEISTAEIIQSVVDDRRHRSHLR
ncbi:MAG: GDP-mannose 4,6-dehydratase [Deltaproteobacteria bacterium]|nr:GDP-mannose 4,6-dehydratase [Deltaproteobacteria bacterium]